MGKTRYQAAFYNGLGTKTTTRANSLAELKDGFWVNDCLDYTTGDDAKCWVPPSMLIHILKVEVDE